MELSITFMKDARALKRPEDKRLFDRQSPPRQARATPFACGVDFAVMVSNLADQRFSKTNSFSLTQRANGLAVSADFSPAEERL